MSRSPSAFLRFLVAVALASANLPAFSAAPSASPPAPPLNTTAAASAPLAAGASFSVTGDWRGGSVPGHAPGRSTLYSNTLGATATWLPALHSVCPVRLSFWVAPHPKNSSAARIEIGRPGETLGTRTVDLTADPARWEPLGTFPFNGSGLEFIRLSRIDRGSLRASALKLEILDPQDSSMAWQTLILDDLAAYDRALLAHNVHAFDDVPSDHILADAVARVVSENILAPVGPRSFAPATPITRADFLAALDRVLAAPAASARPDDASAIFDVAAALRLLVQRARDSGRLLDWIGTPPAPDDTPAWAGALGFTIADDDPILGPGAFLPLSRARAAILLHRFQAAIVHSGPPGPGWILVFQDNFDAPALNRDVWTVSNNQTWGKLLSIRMTANVVQEHGLLRLLTRKERVRDKEWTSGMVGTGRAFRQVYGYWEARMRYATAPGLNNAFWTNPGKGPAGEPGFEIDINEGHWPNTINATLHQTGLASVSRSWRAPADLGRDFHIYACLWTEREIIYYWDGLEIARAPNTHARHPGPVIFSTAVFPWAGSITDKLHNTSMDVDWVRVWRPASPAPASSAPPRSR